VRTRAPFVRGRLVARRRPQKCQEVVVWISIPFDRIRGLDASPGGIPTTTFSFGLEYVLGCLESVARALGHVRAHPGSSLTLLLEGSCRTPFEGQLSLPRDLLRASHPFLRSGPRASHARGRSESRPSFATLTLLFRKKEEGWRMSHYPRLGPSYDDLR
jgi:hypothetical protein